MIVLDPTTATERDLALGDRVHEDIQPVAKTLGFRVLETKALRGLWRTEVIVNLECQACRRVLGCMHATPDRVSFAEAVPSAISFFRIGMQTHRGTHA